MKKIKEDYCSKDLMRLLENTDFEEFMPSFSFRTEWTSETESYKTYPHSLVLKWLREEHRIDIGVGIDTNHLSDGWFYGATIWKSHGYIHTVQRKRYEEAVESALRFTLLNIEL